MTDDNISRVLKMQEPESAVQRCAECVCVCVLALLLCPFLHRDSVLITQLSPEDKNVTET